MSLKQQGGSLKESPSTSPFPPAQPPPIGQFWLHQLRDTPEIHPRLSNGPHQRSLGPTR